MIGRNCQQLVTPEEIIAISGKATTDSYCIADEIRIATEKAYKGEADTQYVFINILANIYEAGRIQGIREERKRKRDNAERRRKAKEATL